MELAVWQFTTLKVFCTKYSFKHSHHAPCLLIATAKSRFLFQSGYSYIYMFDHKYNQVLLHTLGVFPIYNQQDS